MAKGGGTGAACSKVTAGAATATAARATSRQTGEVFGLCGRHSAGRTSGPVSSAGTATATSRTGTRLALRAGYCTTSSSKAGGAVEVFETVSAVTATASRCQTTSGRTTTGGTGVPTRVGAVGLTAASSTGAVRVSLSTTTGGPTAATGRAGRKSV